jgi:hypothetical protein
LGQNPVSVASNQSVWKVRPKSDVGAKRLSYPHLAVLSRIDRRLIWFRGILRFGLTQSEVGVSFHLILADIAAAADYDLDEAFQIEFK